MVASHLQGIFRSARRVVADLYPDSMQNVPAGPDGFRRKGPNLQNGLEVRVMSQVCLCAVQPILPSLNITNATVSRFVLTAILFQAGVTAGPWYVRPYASNAHIVRATLLARATATTFVGRRESMHRRRSGRCFELDITERAP